MMRGSSDKVEGRKAGADERTRELESEVLASYGLSNGFEVEDRTGPDLDMTMVVKLAMDTSGSKAVEHTMPTPLATPAASFTSTFASLSGEPFPHFNNPFQRPTSPTPSTSQLPITPPATPARALKVPPNAPFGTPPARPPLSSPPSPSPQRGHRRTSTGSSKATFSKGELLDVDLEHLIPAGTILLDGYEFGACADDVGALEGWRKLVRGSLEKLPEVASLDGVEEVLSPLSPVLDRFFRPLSPPTASSSSPSSSIATSSHTLPPHNLTPTRPVNRKKRKRQNSTASLPSPSLSLKAKGLQNSILEQLLTLQDALLVKATFATSLEDDGLLIARVYLIPLDLNVKGIGRVRRGNLAVSTTKSVLGSIRSDRDEWISGKVAGAPKMFLEEEDKRSLLELYRAVESPPQDPTFVDELEGASEALKDEFCEALDLSPSGMITELYQYQKGSLTKMLSRELAPQWLPDPAYQKLSCFLDPSKTFYLSVSGEVKLNIGRYQEPKGGILAENMGTGKTAICLALVLSTVGTLPDLTGPSSYLDGSPAPPPITMSPLARTFPFPNFTSEEAKLRRRVPAPLPGYEPSNTEQQEYEAALAFQNLMDAKGREPGVPSLRHILVHKIRSSPTPIPYSEHDERLITTGLFEELNQNTPFYYLHPSAEMQDSREGRKRHFQASRVVVTKATLIVVPTDLVKQWLDEIEKHVERGKLRFISLRTTRDPSPSSEQLSKYDLVLMSISRFSDAAEDLTSPLRRVHWKRLMVDEGHLLAGNNLTRKLAQELRCESRWMISGTPTTNLRDPTGPNGGALSTSDSVTGGNEKDFQRLGEIFSRFLHHPAFARADIWRSIITLPFCEEGRGAARLARILNAGVVRNTPLLVHQSYELPPLHSSIVYLNLDGAELLTYNAVLALYAINGILSQRIHQDYIFHPNNKQHLNVLTLNLAASSSFFSSSEIVVRFQDAIKYAEEGLTTSRSDKWSTEDRDGAREAIKQIKAALADPEWQSIAFSIGLHVELEGVERDILRLFSGLAIEDNSRRRSIAPVSQLVPFRLNLAELRKPSKAAWSDAEELMEEFHTLRRKQLMPEAERLLLEELKPSKRRGKKSGPESLLRVPDDSSFRRMKIGVTTSSKFNYILEQLRRFPDVKFIVFSCTLTDLIFAALSETLDTMGIPHAVFAGQHSVFAGHHLSSTSRQRIRDRGGIAAQFNSTSARDCQVILVDAKLGGRGMNLTAASRVIMLEPVWLPDLEIQAVKRAHRLGQTKPVSLEILVIRGSYEDALLQRRGELKSEDFAKTKLPQGDSYLQKILQSAQYLVATEPRPSPEKVRFLSARDLGDDEPHSAWSTREIVLDAATDIVLTRADQRDLDIEGRIDVLQEEAEDSRSAKRVKFAM